MRKIVPALGGVLKKVLDNLPALVYNNIVANKSNKCDSVAQLDRAFGYEPKGRVFESLQGHQLNPSTTQVFGLAWFFVA
jgi:hypothetical protein